MAATHVFPQSGDADDAENFGQLVGQDNLMEFVGYGGSFTVDYTVPDVTISDTVAYINLNSATASSVSETRYKVGYAVQVSSATKSLTDGDVNHIYVEPGFGTDDNAVFGVYTNTSNAPNNALKIGEIDTSADTKSLDNRAPDHTVENLTVDIQAKLEDDVKEIYGSDSDFSNVYDSSANAYKVRDETNGSDMLVFNKTGPIASKEKFEVSGSNNLSVGSNITTTGGTVIWDGTYIRTARLNLGNGVENSSGAIRVNPADFAGDGLKETSATSMGVEPSNFAGTFLSDDGSDNLTVDLGTGLENDGSGNIRVDEDVGYTFTAGITFSSGLDTQGDITDGSTVIWDASAQYIPQGRLQNDAVTVTAGDGLKNGGTVSLGGSTTIDVEPADFAGTFLSDDGTDNLTVNIGNGLIDSGAGNIEVDESYDFTFTADVDFSAGFDTQGDITDGTAIIWDASAGYIPQGRLQNDSITVTAGDGLKNGGTVALGGSITVDVEPADFAGAGLSDDGSDNLAINAGTNLTISSDTLNVTSSIDATEIKSDTSITFDIDSDNNSSSETISITKDNAATTLFDMGEGGQATFYQGELQTRNGNGYEARADASSLTDGGAVDAPTATFRGYYDSDTSSSVSATARDFVIDHNVQYNGGAGSSVVNFNVGGTDVLRLNEPANEVEITSGTLRISQNADILTRIDSTGGTDNSTFALDVTDTADAIDDVQWLRNPNAAEPFAFHVVNKDTGNGLFASEDDGGARFPSGNVKIKGAQVNLPIGDGSRTCEVVSENRFGAEGATTTATSYTTIAGSDLVFDASDYKDENGSLYIRVIYHLKHEANSGDVSARLYRQNAGTPVDGSTSNVGNTTETLTLNDSFGVADTGWVEFDGEASGFESYQIQLKSSDGEQVGYNSVTIQYGHTQ